MMAKFNEAKFRSDAKAAGYSDEEIDAELGTPAGSAPPASGIGSGPEVAAKFENEFADKSAAIEKG